VAESTRQEMGALARRMRDLIAAQPPLDLLGYIWGQRLLMSLPKSDTSTVPEAEDQSSDTLVDDTQLVLARIEASEDKKNAGPARLGRNEPCWCGSGIKFKKCHGRQP
jgi:hypothetical protein